ncbi:MAG TPA: hypothetical protein VK436_03665 [Methanocella sp.]|nr:hypothetical protein [Methanocella sp.]
MKVMKNLSGFPVIPVVFGMIIGTALSIAFDLLYTHLFQEGSAQFYWFAGLILLGGPLAGGVLTTIMAKEFKLMALLMVCNAVFITVVALAFLSYVILPVFSYDSVQIPASCINDPLSSGSHIPHDVNYTLPGTGTGTLLLGDNTSAVVVMTDYNRFPFDSTIYLINKSDNRVLRSMKFDNDILGAAIYDGKLYLFNDKLLYVIRTDNGEFAKTIIKLDNYKGLFEAEDGMHMQTTLEISVLSADGSVLSHRRMHMSCIAYGCFLP